MAVQAIKPLRQIVETQKADDSGSKWGAVLGALAAGAAIVATGGAAAPAVLAAAGAGASLGGMAGGAFLNKEQKTEQQSLAQRKGQSAPETQSSAIARRAGQQSQNELMALTQAEQSLSQVPPEVAAEYEEPIKRAKKLAQQKYGVA